MNNNSFNSMVMKNAFRVLAVTAICFMVISCSTQQGNDTESNPLLEEFNTPFNVPPFEAIKLSHYEPAFKKAIEENQKEIQAIVENSQEPTFENTIVKLAYSGATLNRIESIFYNLLSAEASSQMQELAKTISAMRSKHYDDIYLNEQLFDRINAVWQQRETLSLSPEDTRLLEETYKKFIRRGAALPAEQQARLREINQELSALSLNFGQNLLAETKEMSLIITDEKQLEGLPESVIAAAKKTAEAAGQDNAWKFTPDKPSLLPFLTYSADPELRAELYKTYYTRGDRNNANDNKALIQKMVNLRLERAKLLGFNSHAEYILAENMAKTPDRVFNMLNMMWEHAIKAAIKERGELEKIMKQEGKQKTLTIADWWYYTEKLRKEKFDLDEEMIRPYLSVDMVREGIFGLANKLYGLTFQKVINIPVYHKDVEAYEVFEEDGQHLAIIYFDFFPRPGKSSGAWCTSFESQHKTQDGENVSPIISIVCNFTPPTPGQPALLLFDEAETMFHEFGHALHSFFSNITYPTLGRTPRDFVEMPSQILEHWASHPDYLPIYAKHYQTGEPMPAELIEKISKSAHFNTGFNTTELLASALLDMYYHSITEPIDADINAFEKEKMDKLGLIPEILPRYRSTYFSHVFDGGYSAGYYSYTWSEMLDCDAYQAFVEDGEIFNKQVAQKFRKTLLEPSGSKDAMQMFIDFRGREPIVEPLLKNRGFKE